MIAFAWGGLFVFHGLLMAIDELYFHRRRGLAAWERWGHPLDTLTVMLVITLALFQVSLPVFIVAGIFSSLFVTKDEWIHHTACDASENWLHALLFLLHPVLCYAVWQLKGHRDFLVMLLFGVALFLSYQVIYWGIRRDQ